jgi:hypothetical protein
VARRDRDRVVGDGENTGGREGRGEVEGRWIAVGRGREPDRIGRAGPGIVRSGQERLCLGLPEISGKHGQGDSLKPPQ